MNLNIYQSNGERVPQTAIIGYGVDSKHIELVTKHDITQTGTGPVIQAGQTVTNKSLQTMFESVFNKIQRPLCVLDENIIALNSEVVVWWVPAQACPIRFRAAKIGKRSAITPQPPLLFWKTERSWFVLALKENKRPTGSSELAFSPYLNVGQKGMICIGTGKIPDDSDEFNPNAWNQAFFASAFTHSNNQKKFVDYKGGISALWKDLLDGKFSEYPMETLIKNGLTLNDLLKQLRGNHAS